MRPGIAVIEPVNKLFVDAVDYQSSRLIITLTWYDDHIANELNKMTKKTVVLMKVQILNGRDQCLQFPFFRTSRKHEMYKMSMKEIWYEYSTTTSAAQSDPSSRRTLRYQPRLPEHKKGTWCRITRSSTTWWGNMWRRAIMLCLWAPQKLVGPHKKIWWQATICSNSGIRRSNEDPSILKRYSKASF